MATGTSTVTQRAGKGETLKRNKAELADDEQWIDDLDMEKFKAEVQALGRELEQGQP